MFSAVAGRDELPGKAVLVVDISGSMVAPLSRRAEMKRPGVLPLQPAAACANLTNRLVNYGEQTQAARDPGTAGADASRDPGGRHARVRRRRPGGGPHRLHRPRRAREPGASLL